MRRNSSTTASHKRTRSSYNPTAASSSNSPAQDKSKKKKQSSEQTSADNSNDSADDNVVDAETLRLIEQLEQQDQAEKNYADTNSRRTARAHSPAEIPIEKFKPQAKQRQNSLKQSQFIVNNANSSARNGLTNNPAIFAQPHSNNLLTLLRNRSMGLSPVKQFQPYYRMNELDINFAHFKRYSAVVGLKAFGDHERVEIMTILPTSGYQSIHSLHSPLVAMGSKLGQVAIWSCPAIKDVRPKQSNNSIRRGGALQQNEEQKINNGFLQVESVHSARVKGLSWSVGRHSLITAGPEFIYEIELSAAELGASDLILHSEQNMTCMNADIPNLILAGDETGRLLLRDLRVNIDLTQSYNLHLKKTSNVCVHPRNSNLLVTSCNIYEKGSGSQVCSFDMRKLESSSNPQPFQQIQYNKVVKAMKFSANGEYLLTTSYDDYVRVYRSSSAAIIPEEICKFSHVNQVGLWVSDFKPTFHPENSDLFLIGNVRQHGVSLFSIKHNREVANLADPNAVTGVQSLAEIAGGCYDNNPPLITTSYGKAFLWAIQDQEEV
jgi:WD40 repeat protein